MVQVVGKVEVKVEVEAERGIGRMGQIGRIGRMADGWQMGQKGE